MRTDISILEAIRRLFDINVSSDSPYLKDKANTFVRNGLVKVYTESGITRGKKFLADQNQMTVLHNALVLNAFYHDPKDVKKIFEDEKMRLDAATSIKLTLVDQTSICGILLCSSKVTALIKLLESEQNLYQTRIPNPFASLPQLAMGKNSGLLHKLLIQASLLQPIDNALCSIAQGDWKTANEICKNLNTDTPGASKIRNMIDEQLKEATKFDEVLDFFRKI